MSIALGREMTYPKTERQKMGGGVTLALVCIGLSL